MELRSGNTKKWPGRPKKKLTKKKKPKYSDPSTTYKTSARERAFAAERKRKQRGKAKKQILSQETFFYNDAEIRRELPRDLFHKLVVMTEYELRGIKTYSRSIMGNSRQWDRGLKSFTYEKAAIEIVKYATERYLANLIYDSATIAKYARGRNKITWKDLVAVNNIYKRHGLPYTMGKFEDEDFYKDAKSSTVKGRKDFLNYILTGDKEIFDWDPYDMIGHEYRVHPGQNTTARVPKKRKKNRAKEEAKREQKETEEQNKEIMKEIKKASNYWKSRTLLDVSDKEIDQVLKMDGVATRGRLKKFTTFGDEGDDVHPRRTGGRGNIGLYEEDEEDDQFNKFYK